MLYKNVYAIATGDISYFILSQRFLYKMKCIGEVSSFLFVKHEWFVCWAFCRVVNVPLNADKMSVFKRLPADTTLDWLGLLAILIDWCVLRHRRLAVLVKISGAPL